MSSWSCCAPSGRRVTSSGDGARRRCPAPSSLPTISASGARPAPRGWAAAHQGAEGRGARCPAPSSLPTISASGSRSEPSVWAALNRGSKDRRSRVSNGRPTARAVASRLADSAMSFCAPENACCASWLVPICCASPLRLSCRIVELRADPGPHRAQLAHRAPLALLLGALARLLGRDPRLPGLRRLGVRQRHLNARRQPRVRLEAERRELLGHRPLRDLVLPLLLTLRRELGEVHERLARLRAVEPRPERRKGQRHPEELVEASALLTLAAHQLTRTSAPAVAASAPAGPASRRRSSACHPARWRPRAARAPAGRRASERAAALTSGRSHCRSCPVAMRGSGSCPRASGSRRRSLAQRGPARPHPQRS